MDQGLKEQCESCRVCGRLALWCVKCNPAEQLSRGLCVRCSRSSQRSDGVCASCFDGGLGEKSMKMHAKGKWCRKCTSAGTSVHGTSLEEPGTNTWRFVNWCSCCGGNIAVWCGTCYHPEVLARKLCVACLVDAKCAYCGPRGGGDRVSNLKCGVEGCDDVLTICAGCLEANNGVKLLCHEHWAKNEYPCICEGCMHSASHDMRYARRCPSCLQKDGLLYEYTLGSERQKWSDALGEEQEILWTEPALQILLLPLNTATPLPTYSPTPDYLPPRHCRLCFHDGGDGPIDGCGLTSELVRHVREVHGLEPSAYRRHVLRQIAAVWPTEVTAQVLRARLAGYKMRVTDESFKAGVCACCAREEQRCELLRVVFPPVDEKHAPDWLGWDDATWQVCLFCELAVFLGGKPKIGQIALYSVVVSDLKWPFMGGMSG